MTDATEPIEVPRPATPGAAKAFVLLAIVGLYAYFNSLHGSFLLDDTRFLIDPNIGHPLHSTMAPRPVIAISLAINYWIDGMNPRGYHAMNLAIHVLAAFVLYDLVRRTLLLPRYSCRFETSAGWIGLACGLLWLVHPLQTQSVTYVIQRCESLMGLFFLTSLWCFVRGATAERGRWWYAAAFAACALGAGCKELMIVLAPLAFLYDRTFIAGSWRAALRARWWVYLALTVPPIVGALALILTGFLTDSGGTVGFGVKVFTPYTYALTQTEVILHYLRLSVYPVGLTLDYLDWKPCTSLADCWPSVAAIALLLGFTVYGVIRRTAWGFLAAWFFLILAPTSSVIPVQDAAFEHRMYLPLVGIVVLIGGLATIALKLAERNGGRVLAVAAGAAVLVLATMTAARNEDYSSALKLFADNAAKRPENGRVRLNLAIQQFANGLVAEAEQNLYEAMRLPLQVPSVRTQRVKVLRESGRVADAAILARQLYDEKPDSDEDAFELALCLLTEDRLAESLPLLRRVCEKSPANKFGRLHYGVALWETGHPIEADAEFRATRELDPDYAALLMQTARRVANDPNAQPSNVKLAARYATAANRMIDAPTVESLDTRAICLARAGNYSEAAVEAAKAAGLARARGDAYLASRIDARAARFRSGKSFLPELRTDGTPGPP